jgi:hypothetical protein
MAQHLTRTEMQAIVASARKEILLGILLVVAASACVVILSGMTGVIPYWAGFASTGAGMIVHGLYRRSQAKSSIAHAPDARVVSMKR